MRPFSTVTLYLGQAAMRDVVLKIGQLSPNFSVFKEFTSHESFSTLITCLTPTVLESFNRSFSIEVDRRQIEWPADLPRVTLMSNAC